MSRRRRGLEPMHDDHVNVTPLIDVVMCLIIFFLACSHMTKNETKDNVQIPRAELGQDMDDRRGQLMINLVPVGRDKGNAAAPIDNALAPQIFVRSHEVSLKELPDALRRLKAETPDLKVILRADEDLSYAWISPVLVSCAQANITNVNFSIRK